MPEIDTLIQKYLQDQTTEEENKQLQQWMLHSHENEKRFFAEKDIWDTTGFHANRKEYDTIPELELFKKRIEGIAPRQNILFRRMLQMAAMLLVTFGLGWATRFISLKQEQKPPLITMQEIFVPKGQVNQVFLADGTRIWINSDTHLTIPSVFTSKERVVQLSGEAFFSVAKDANRPFRVEVKGQQIEVLGTTFNVRAYDNSDEIETTLETGQIKLLAGNQTASLQPGEQSIFDKSSNKLTVEKVDPLTFSSWKNGRYEFHNKDLTEVFKIVERWYDVEITMDENYFSKMHFSGVIKRNKDVQHFLELLNHTVPISYEMNADKIQIVHK
ncbi:MAG: FecR domain-containing protein [Prolixibacteraceae bacterium]